MQGNSCGFLNMQRAVKVDRQLKEILRSAAEAVVLGEGISDPFEVCIMLAGLRKIKELNNLHRGLDRPTDVLSFPASLKGEFEINPESGRIFLGDIVLCPAKAASQAQEYGHSFEREAAYLTAHSVLHLLGYDHENDEQREEMRKKEESAMKKIGLEISDG